MKTTGRNLNIDYKFGSITINFDKQVHKKIVEDSYTVPVESLEAYIIKACKRSEEYTIAETVKTVIFKISRAKSEEEITLHRDTSEDIIINIINNLKRENK